MLMIDILLSILKGGIFTAASKHALVANGSKIW
jgi:hypothetical protein